MGLSKKYLNYNIEEVSFSPDKLAEGIKIALPEIVFAYILGSSAENCIIKPRSDLDLAVYISGTSSPGLYSVLQDVVDEYIGQVRVDVGLLNRAEPVFRYEALKGRLLFVRDKEQWLRFFSITCREYESQIFHYKKQLQYRLGDF